MNYEEFFREAVRRELRLARVPSETRYVSSLDNEALFQLPLLAMVVLTLSKASSKPRLQELGQIVGACLERTVAGFKGSSQEIGWSANLRIRTVKALTFLEKTGFVVVDPHSREVAATQLGRQLISGVLCNESPLAHALLVIERSFENLRAEQRIREEA
jgi:hypothetical protein